MSKELKGYGLTHEQYNVLRILKGKYPEQMCVRDIACRMIEKSSNVPRIIDRLEVKKLVKRSTSPNDKRETVITLTQAGINILAITTDKINKLLFVSFYLILWRHQERQKGLREEQDRTHPPTPRI